MKARALLAAIALAALAALLPATAHGFGTINGSGQSAEHEKITRAALSCDASGAPKTCFEPKSIRQLAGGGGFFGAVGAPDEDEITDESAHCDGADFLVTPGYPQSRADATTHLFACLQHERARMRNARRAAKSLLGKRSQIDEAEVSLKGGDCGFAFDVDFRAKCKTLEQFGRALHTSEDFYSHSNWADQESPARPTGPGNPPGLNQSGLAPFLDSTAPLAAASVPAGLSTGCFTVNPFSSACDGRVTHDVVNKDEGVINPRTGATSDPTTERGRIRSNFAQAVRGAILEARRHWKVLQDTLVDEYGRKKADRMICALTHDDPLEDCVVHVSLEGVQRTTWSVDSFFPDGCGHIVGSGTNVIEFSTDKPKTTAVGFDDDTPECRSSAATCGRSRSASPAR